MGRNIQHAQTRTPAASPERYGAEDIFPNRAISYRIEESPPWQDELRISERWNVCGLRRFPARFSWNWAFAGPFIGSRQQMNSSESVRIGRRFGESTARRSGFRHADGTLWVLGV